MKRLNNKKGFTLIEILIVVVILAILASLILPKFLAQSEGALLAEANQVVAAMHRGQQNYMQAANVTSGVEFSTPPTASEWAQLGMSMPSGGSFTYTTDGSTITATRTSGTLNGATAVFDFSLGAPTWTLCDGGYTMVDSGNSSKGCRV